MNIKDIANLSLESQLDQFKKIREEFNREKEDLKKEIRKLEDSKKEKEAHAKELVAGTKVHKQAEISTIVSSIKGVKNELDIKSRELLFIEKAIQNAEKLLSKTEDEVIENELRRELKLITEQLLRKEDDETEKEREKRLEKLLEDTRKEDKKNEKKDSKEEKKEKTLEEELEDTEITEKAKKKSKEKTDYIGKPGEGPKSDYIANPELGDKMYDPNSGKDYITEEENKDYTSHPDDPKGDYLSHDDSHKSDYMHRPDEEGIHEKSNYLVR